MASAGEVRPVSGPRACGASFRAAGAAVLGCAALCPLPPALAQTAAGTIPWLLALWGLSGLALAASVRRMPEARPIATIYALTLGLGVVLAALPDGEAAVRTAALAVVCLLDGTVSILLGLRLGGRVDGWRGLVASGACGFLLAGAIVVSWPTSSPWPLGAMTCLGLVARGGALLRLSPRTDPPGA
jgi:uncharacterized membrane protein HdeD (DUF308 family)